MSKTLPIARSATHGARLTVETVAHTDYSEARVEHDADTLLRVIEGSLLLHVADHERVLELEDEARIPAGHAYRLASAGTGEARILIQLRAA